MTQSLLLFDTDHIKRYVFATDKLREIRAASAILDRLNRQTMVNIAKNQENGGKKVYANGGSGLFLVDTAKAKKISDEIKAEYRVQTTLASLTGVAVNGLETVDWHSTDISHQQGMLGHKLQLAKDGQRQDIPLLTHSFLNYCRSCGVEYASEPVTENGQPKLVCRSCGKKVKHDKDEIKDKLQGYVQEVLNGRKFKKATYGNGLPHARYESPRLVQS